MRTSNIIIATRYLACLLFIIGFIGCATSPKVPVSDELESEPFTCGEEERRLNETVEALKQKYKEITGEELTGDTELSSEEREKLKDYIDPVSLNNRALRKCEDRMEAMEIVKQIRKMSREYEKTIKNLGSR